MWYIRVAKATLGAEKLPQGSAKTKTEPQTGIWRVLTDSHSPAVYQY